MLKLVSWTLRGFLNKFKKHLRVRGLGCQRRPTLPPHPCKLSAIACRIETVAMAKGRSSHPGALKPAPQQERAFVDPLHPNSRQGRFASPFRQGGVKMEVFVGIDISKDLLDVFVHPSGQSLQVENSQEGLHSLCNVLLAAKADLVVMEASGGYESLAAGMLSNAGLAVAVVNPAQVRSFAHALKQKAKTDQIDAMVIARFAEAVRPRVDALPDQQAQLLGNLITRRRQILQMVVAEQQRLSRAKEARLIKSLNRVIKALKKELGEIDGGIDQLVRSSPLWRHKEDLLQSVPGVGKIVARTLMAEMPELGQLDRRQIASLAGLAPFTRQSGKWRGKSFISGGRGSVRAIMFIASMSASRHHPQMKLFYQKLLAAGKPKMVALIAIARRLLILLNAILRDQKPWQNA